jgi:outer membrane protein assembly factor BamD
MGVRMRQATVNHETGHPRRGWRAPYVRGVLLLATVLVCLQGCAIYDKLYGSPPRREASQSDQALLRSAEADIQRRRYEDARKNLQRLMNQYPDSDLVISARLTLAKALYLDKKYEEARTEYQRFLELHPQSERVDEAHYYLGMTFFRMADTPDRDQTATQKALEEFDILIKQVPDSPFVPDAQQRAVMARKKLAEKEVYVAAFYFSRENYAAAVARAAGVLQRYPGSEFEDQALYYLGESLWRLEQKDEARLAFQRLVQDHAQSEWAPVAARRLGTTLVRTGQPKPPGPGLWEQVKQAMEESWNELTDTARSYKIFQ